MVDISKQIEYWQESAKEDWEVAWQLLNTEKTRHSLFFAHIALEKLLKALLCKNTQELAPRIHNLSRLAELAAITLNSNQLEILAEMNAFHIEGRYPDSLMPPPTITEAHKYILRAKEVFEWLMHQL